MELLKMQITFIPIVIIICIFFNVIQSKSLESYYGNSISHYKGQRKPLASPMENSINDNYKRAKRQVPPAITEFQKMINKSKKECLHDMNMNPQIINKTLMNEQFPTRQEKCLMMCMLKKAKLMENNKLSVDTIARFAGSMSDNNPLVVSIATATAKNCNNHLKATEPCEAAYQINRCIAKELKARKLLLSY